MDNEGKKNGDFGNDTESEAKKEIKEENERKNEAAKAAEYLNEQRRLAHDPEVVGKGYPHEEKDTSYMDEKEKKITVGSILKYIFYGIVVFVFLLIFYRIYMQNDSNFDFAEMFIWTDEAIEAYEENGNLTVYTQSMGRIGNLVLVNEADETESYDYEYSPYSEADGLRGCFMTGNIMYVVETEQLIFTFRVNRTASEAVMDRYGLESAPRRDCYSFALYDGEKYYTEYEYVTAERSTYFYYRIVFTGVSYDLIENPYQAQTSDVTELTLNVYYDDLKNFDSPIDTMTLANNLISAEEYDIEDTLPAQRTEGLVSDVSFELDSSAQTGSEDSAS